MRKQHLYFFKKIARFSYKGVVVSRISGNSSFHFIHS